MLTGGVHIQIWSDVVCPWCYIGTTNLRKALGDTDATVVFRSFQLDPTAPAQPVPSLQHLRAKYGPQADQMMDHVTEVAARAGLTYHMRDSWAGQTLDAHRVLHHALAEGLQDELAMRIFAAQFTEGRSLFDADSLVGLCEDVGLSGDAVREVLASDAYAGDVARDIAQARTYGITGVPFFVFDERLAVSGAQSVEVFGQAIAQASSA